MRSQHRRRWTLPAIGAALLSGGGIWRYVERAGDVDFLMGISSRSPIVQWVIRNGDYLLILAGIVLLLLNIGPRPVESVSRRLMALRSRWKLRHWTDAGLNWVVLRDSHTTLRDGRMAAILSITPVPDSDLPQPLDIIITCAGRIAEVSSRFYRDASEVGKTDTSGDVEIDAPQGKTVAVRLCSPKLLPPCRWDLTLTSAGNAEIKVLDVKRAPRK